MSNPSLTTQEPPYLATLGMFIIDTFEFDDPHKSISPQIGGGGTYANVGARIWLPPTETSMVVDCGHDFPPDIRAQLDGFGSAMWVYRERPDKQTTRAVNTYKGELREFEYLTPRTQITPKDLDGARYSAIHFICSPKRASVIMNELRSVQGWNPRTIFEPIPYRCVPEELPALIEVLPSIFILSPNADEAFCILSMDQTTLSRSTIEVAASKLLSFGIGPENTGWVVIRSGELGAYVANKDSVGAWVDAYWTRNDDDQKRVVDVTGCGNGFLGGLAAGLKFESEDVVKAAFYGTVSASYVIEQQGLPVLSIGEDGVERWNGNIPSERLANLRTRHGV